MIRLIAIGLCAVASIQCLCEIYVFWLYRQASRKNIATSQPDTILILGARPHSTHLQRRLVRAAAAHRLFPNARMVLSGNERLGEVSAMQSGLQTLGVAGPFVLELVSTTTFENLRLSKPHLGKITLIVTNDFHLPRAIALGSALGIPLFPFAFEDSEPKPSLPGWFRERLAVLKAAVTLLFP